MRKRDFGSCSVLHVCPEIFSHDGTLGGAERYSFELARAMAGSTSTQLLSFGRQGRHWQEGPLTVRVLGRSWHVRGLSQNPIHPGLLREVLRADVVHVHQKHTVAASLSALVRQVRRRPTFVTDHGGGGWDVSSYMDTDGWYNAHLHVSRFSRAAAAHNPDIASEVIYGGVDGSRFSVDCDHPPSERVLFVGRVLPHKGLDWLIQAMPAEMPLDIVGPVAADYRLFLSELAIGKRVIFHGPVSETALVEAYRRAGCVVLPSVYQTHEGQFSRLPELLGQTLLEGMSCGRPVICSDVGGMPEVVEHGHTGYVVPERDADALRLRLEELRANPALRTKLGQQGRERCERLFSWPRVARRCLEAYLRYGGVPRSPKNGIPRNESI